MSACAELVEKHVGRSPLGDLDHYTIIVENAEEVANFHREVLGFTLLEVRPLNTGTALNGEYDMLNYILAFPGHSQRTMVITEGLTDESYFRRHLKERGPGIHHIAYRVEDIEVAMRSMHSAGGTFLSEEPITDPVSNLRQVFLRVPGAGYTMELIERSSSVTHKTFDDGNMVGLAGSMNSVKTQAAGSPGLTNVERLVRVELFASVDQVREVLGDIGRLGEWTGHRTLRRFENTWIEVRFNGDVEVVVQVNAHEVSYTWMEPGDSVRFSFEMESIDEQRTRVTFSAPSELPIDKWCRQKEVLEAEFALLRSILGENIESSKLTQARALVDVFAGEVVRR